MSTEDKALLEAGPFDTRNVADKYKGWTVEAIQADLSAKSSALIVAASNELRDFNWGTVVRCANNFNVDKVVFTGKRRWDRRGAVGAHNYTRIDYVETAQDLVQQYRSLGYRIVAAEYLEGDSRMQPLTTYQWADRTVLFFGEEGRSLDEDVLTLMDDIVSIPALGSVRSLNVATAAGIMLYDYTAKTARL